MYLGYVMNNLFNEREIDIVNRTIDEINSDIKKNKEISPEEKLKKLNALLYLGMKKSITNNLIFK